MSELGAEGITSQRERLERAFSYEPETGILRWRIPTEKSRMLPGSIAGSINKSTGYVHVRLQREMFYAHRVAWLLTFGEWPPKHIDHINGNRIDNRISNLRLATRQENARNRISKANKTGVMGVREYKGGKEIRYYASIRYDGKWHHLGSFKTLEEAKLVRLDAERKIFGGFAPSIARVA